MASSVRIAADRCNGPDPDRTSPGGLRGRGGTPGFAHGTGEAMRARLTPAPYARYRGKISWRKNQPLRRIVHGSCRTHSCIARPLMAFQALESFAKSWPALSLYCPPLQWRSPKGPALSILFRRLPRSARNRGNRPEPTGNRDGGDVAWGFSDNRGRRCPRLLRVRRQ